LNYPFSYIVFCFDIVVANIMVSWRQFSELKIDFF
jgi:hypothetical protein